MLSNHSKPKGILHSCCAHIIFSLELPQRVSQILQGEHFPKTTSQHFRIPIRIWLLHTKRYNVPVPLHSVPVVLLLAPAAAVSHGQTVTLQRTQKDIQPSMLGSKQVPAPTTTTRLKWALRFQLCSPQFRFVLLIQLVDHNKRLVCARSLPIPGDPFLAFLRCWEHFSLRLLIFALFPRSHALVTPSCGLGKLV